MRLLCWLSAIGVLIVSNYSMAQVILTEVMFKPDTLPAYDEFVEIYNASTVPVDLSNWRIGDGLELDLLLDAGDGLLLQPQQFGLILDPGYFDNSSTYDSLIPPEALILTIDDASFGKQGFSNTQSEPVTLLNAVGDTVQVYAYSPDNLPGYSDEKIILSADNSSTNWSNSREFRGTPGRRNSVSPKEIDMAIYSFDFIDPDFLAGENLSFIVWGKNVGLKRVAGFRWLTFYDWNDNFFPDENEVLQRYQDATEVFPGDSLQLSGQFSNIPAGQVPFGVSIEAEGDEDSTNNVVVQLQFINSPFIQLVINEIMFEPRPGEEEWLEIVNSGVEDVNLAYLYFADARDTIQVSQEDRYLLSGEFLVLAGDSAVIEQYHVPMSRVCIDKKFPTLNNDTDDLKLLGTGNIVFDHVTYTSDWYGRDTEAGISLEKIHPKLNSQISHNWAGSVDPSGSTPGRINSIFTDLLLEVASLQIRPNPFSPDGDGFEDFTIIRLEIPVETSFVTIRIFDTRGRLIRFLADAQPVAHQSSFVWDGKDDRGRMARIGAYICLVQALNSNKNVFKELKASIILVKN